MTLTQSEDVNAGPDCQSISASRYLPVVIKDDGVINKGELQVRNQPSTSIHTDVVTGKQIRKQIDGIFGTKL